eukprot:5693111-Pyramimonas_sp.AAC.1
MSCSIASQLIFVVLAWENSCAGFLMLAPICFASGVVVSAAAGLLSGRFAPSLPRRSSSAAPS